MEREGAQRRPQAGFTLLEVLVSLGVFLLVLATIVLALDSNRGAYVRGGRKMDAQQNARLALGEIVREVRMTGYFPENFGPSPASPPSAAPIRIATDDSLAVFGDADGSGTSHVFVYCLDGSILRRGRAVESDPAAYWCPAGEVLAENVSALSFAYFDEDGATLPDPPSAPFALDGEVAGVAPDLSDLFQRGAVRRVVITITVTEPVPGQGPHEFTLGSEVRLRNVG